MIEIKVKNNYFIQKMNEKGFKTSAELSRVSGVTQNTIGDFLNLKSTPYSKITGKLKDSIIKIEETLGCKYTDLFPVRHIEECFNSNFNKIEMDFEEAVPLLESQGYDGEHQLISRVGNDEVKSLLSTALSTLTPMEENIIRRRFLEGETIKEASDYFNISRARIQQIENRAIRKMRHPSRSRGLRDFC